MTDKDNKEKLRSKARKLKELANRGIGGEKNNAEKKYLDYLKKHDLEDSEINPNMNSREFNGFVDNEECDIATTVILSINPYAKYNVRKNSISVELDDEDYKEIEGKIDYFIKLWRIEKNALRTAFAIRHNDFFKPDEYSLKKWRENRGNVKSKEEEVKNEFKDINTSINNLKDEYQKNPDKVISDVFNSEDDTIRTAFNFDRSIEMSSLLLLANYIKKNRRLEEEEQKSPTK